MLQAMLDQDATPNLYGMELTKSPSYTAARPPPPVPRAYNTEPTTTPTSGSTSLQHCTNYLPISAPATSTTAPVAMETDENQPLRDVSQSRVQAKQTIFCPKCSTAYACKITLVQE